MVETTSTGKLRVIIVGAGICGLATGAALRAFADVTILESASEIKEFGAAVHLAPNAHRVVQKLGGELFKYGSVPCTGMKEYTKDGVKKLDFKFDVKKEFGLDWILCHRVDVQAELKELAIRPDGPGEPCKVHVNCRVASVETETGKVTLASGETFQADVVIGCDGIKSAVRTSVLAGTSSQLVAKPSAHSAYRMLVPAEKIKADPELEAIGCIEGLVVIDGGDRRIICYPCRGKSLVNFVCCLPDSELNEISEEKWSARGDVAKLVKSFESFSPVYQKLLSQGTEAGLWQLRDQDPLDRWTKDRCIIVGDAAHAMLPHQGQGASQALEDAEALGAILSRLPANPSADEVRESLEHVFRARFKRATRVQQVSRFAGLGEMRKQGEAQEMEDKEYFNMMKFRNFNWDYHGVEKWEQEHPEWVIAASS